ncbi:hypothetical protein ABEB36_014150 [Hypothenemus hampei]|uniref:Uncharacterized protein n=1 Tax=Hypothenemus hampei TaxID=57062 RepID=A0ABD1E3G9_HYPHA
MESYVFLEDYLSDILDAITFARLKILHSSIITPVDLMSSLEQISQSLSKNNLPLPTYMSNVAKYLDIIELEAYQTEGKIVFILKIPLVEPEHYILYRIFPIPILEQRRRFFTVQDLNNCKTLKGKERICSNILQYPIDSDAVCEAQLLRQQNVLPKTCQTSIVLVSDYNVEEINQNYWLISISEALPITIRCGLRKLISEVLKTNSLLKLQPNCNAFIGSTRIHSRYPCCQHLPLRDNVPELKPLKLSKINIEDLNIAQHRLNQYSEKLDKLMKQPFISKHIHWFTIVTISVTIILTILYICCKCRSRKPSTLCLPGTGNSPPSSSPMTESGSTKHQFRKLLPRRRTSIHPEPPTIEESFELNLKH